MKLSLQGSTLQTGTLQRTCLYGYRRRAYIKLDLYRNVTGVENALYITDLRIIYIQETDVLGFGRYVRCLPAPNGSRDAAATEQAGIDEATTTHASAGGLKSIDDLSVI